MKIYVLTAATFDKAKTELKNTNCEIRILTGDNQDVQKEEFVAKLGPERVVAIGNENDRKMLKAAHGKRHYKVE